MKKQFFKIILVSLMCIGVTAVFPSCTPTKEPADNIGSGDPDSGGTTAEPGTADQTEAKTEPRTEFTETAFEFPPADAYDGIKLDENGRLAATAYNKVQTFENGKTPLGYIYVSPDGNDTEGSGAGTRENPYRTVNYAISKAEPGTSIWMMPGIYKDSIFIHGLNGTEENPIWIGGIPGEERPVISVDNGSAAIISIASYIIIHDIEINGTSGFGFNTDDGGVDYDREDITHHIIYRNLYLLNNEDCPMKFAGANYVWIFDCEFEQGENNKNTGGVIAIDAVGGHHFYIGYNYIHDIPNQMGEGHGILFKGGSYDINIYGNLFVKAGQGVTIGQSTDTRLFRPRLIWDAVDKSTWPGDVDYETHTGTDYEAKDARIYSNIFIDVATPIAFGSSANSYFVNNTVINPIQAAFRILNNHDQWWTSKLLANNGAGENNTVSNNIFYNGSKDANIGPNTTPETFTVSNNIFFRGKLSYTDFISYSTNISQNPGFADFAGGDYSLAQGSPAAETGLNTFSFVKEDYFGKAFDKVAPSIGAIQFSED